MKEKRFWFFLVFGIVLFIGSFGYYSNKCAIFQTDWYACTIPECKISSFVEAFSVGILITTISLWMVMFWKI
jgi:uncharacterized membrane protein